ncbi:MAG: hypothetical protein IT423_14720 [Pirellulaceae bacterium]|nr:hypothetical protein [Pirellulaceae bacterium]
MLHRIGQAILLALVAWPLVFSLPDWFRATWIGVCWGAILIVGLSACWVQRRLAWSGYCLCAMALAHQGLSVVTDLEPNARWLLITCLLAGGWSVGMLCVPWQTEGRAPTVHSNRDQQSLLRSPRCWFWCWSWRWSLWDIGCLTSLVALLSWLIPRVENQFELTCQLAPALVGGCMISLMAVQWAWHDRWSVCGLLLMLGAIPLICMGCMPWVGIERDTLALFLWMIAGPVSVMTAQGLTVLSYMSILRFSSASR